MSLKLREGLHVMAFAYTVVMIFYTLVKGMGSIGLIAGNIYFAVLLVEHILIFKDRRH